MMEAGVEAKLSKSDVAKGCLAYESEPLRRARRGKVFFVKRGLAHAG